MSTSPLITLSKVEKSYGTQSLFTDLSLTVGENERLGIIGPNGAGKSTLLRVIANLEEIDSGSVLRKRGIRVSYVAQSESFSEEKNVFELANEVASSATHSEAECQRVINSSLAAMKLDEHDVPVSNLSGGQKKRLQIALGLCKVPDLLLLDEPTNHLDIGSIVELERFLNRAVFSWVVVSHDRWFLENAVSKIAEIDKRYSRGVLVCEGGYGEFLKRKGEVTLAQQKQRASLENKVRNEQAWLRQGAKARTTKAKGRIDRAYQMMETLSLVRAKQKDRKVDISFTSSERKTKRLVEFCHVGKSFGDLTVFSNLNLKLMAGQALGVLGENGTGKSTFVKLLAVELEPTVGVIERANNLSISHFRQFHDDTPAGVSLKSFLIEEGDSVVFRGQSTHVSSWARRFQFDFEQLTMPYVDLSGACQKIS